MTEPSPSATCIPSAPPVWRASWFLALSIAQWMPWILLGAAAGFLDYRISWLLGMAVFAAVLRLFARDLRGRALPPIGLGWGPGRGREVATGLGLGLVVYSATFLIRWWLGALPASPAAHDASALLTVLLAGLLVAFYQAFSEEVVFRGVLFSLLPARFSVGARILIGAAVFIVYHAPKVDSLLHGPYSLHLLFAGVAFGLAYALTGSLWLGIGLHWGWNLGAYALLEGDATIVTVSPAVAYSWSEWSSWMSVLGNVILLLIVAGLGRRRDRATPMSVEARTLSGT